MVDARLRQQVEALAQAGLHAGEPYCAAFLRELLF